jgi:hypothetical protein
MGGEGVSFHTFMLPEERCVRHLVKNLCRGMPDSMVQEELESLDIRVQGVMQLCYDCHNQDPAKDRPPTPTSLYRWRGGPGESRVGAPTSPVGALPCGSSLSAVAAGATTQ